MHHQPPLERVALRAKVVRRRRGKELLERVRAKAQAKEAREGPHPLLEVVALARS